MVYAASRRSGRGYMDFLIVLFIGISLAFDCFAVSLSAGSHGNGRRHSLALLLGSCFGIFQAGMLFLGHFGAFSLIHLISGLDHWVAFGILVLIGSKMMFDGVRGDEEEGSRNFFSPETLVALSLATSIDALGVGLSLALIGDGIVRIAIVAGLVSFLFSVAGIYLGRRLSERFGKRFEIVGGIILIAIGTRILLEHLFSA